MSDLSYTDPDAAATCLLIWDLIPLMGVPVTKEIATCCYTGTMTDTGRFQYQNATQWVFDAAGQMVHQGADPAAIATAVFQNRTLASLLLEERMISRIQYLADGQAVMSWLYLKDFEELGAKRSDSEPLINTLRSLRGIRVACILRENQDDIRGSLRAKDHTDVASVARAFGGGGHRVAAGFTIFSHDIDSAKRKVTQAIEDLLNNGADERYASGSLEGTAS